MLASAAATYVERFAVLPGDRAAIFTTNDASGLRSADPTPDGRRRHRADPRRGRGCLRSARRGRSAACLRRMEPEPHPVAVDRRGPPVRRAPRVPSGPNGEAPPWLDVVGSADGDGLSPNEAFWLEPAADYSAHFVDLQRDQTVADIEGALRAGLVSVEHVKRATYIGTAIDQGRTSGVLAAAHREPTPRADPEAQGPTSARPPAVPLSYAVIAGPDRGALLDPIRRTRVHPWHVEHGAIFEDVGQWKRPSLLPRRRGGDGRRGHPRVPEPCATPPVFSMLRPSGRSMWSVRIPRRSSTGCTRTG